MISKLLNKWVLSLIKESVRAEIRRALIVDYLTYGDPARLKISKTAIVNNALFNLISGEITIEEFAFFGHGVSLLTGTHDYNLFDRERQITSPTSGRDIIVGRGVWIGSNATILGPCIIGQHAVVAAGALVVKDVAPGTIVGGIPAKLIRSIEASSKVLSEAKQ